MAFSATNDCGSIASFAATIGAPIGITSASLSLVFSISDRIAKDLLIQWEKRKTQ